MNIAKNEKRRSTRVPVNTSALLHTDSHRGRAVCDVAVGNISETGVAMEGPVEFNVGDCCQMRMDLPSGRSLNGRVQIVWKKRDSAISRFNYGAQLVDIDWWNKRKLRSYIHHSEALGYLQCDSSFDAYEKAVVGCLAVFAGVVWYHLVASFGWDMAFLGVGGILMYCLIKFKSRRASVNG
ncbi:MAG: PilZ domain-containing protein [Elusimicrobiota bacterium]